MLLNLQLQQRWIKGERDDVSQWGTSRNVFLFSFKKQLPLDFHHCVLLPQSNKCSFQEEQIFTRSLQPLMSYFEILFVKKSNEEEEAADSSAESRRSLRAATDGGGILLTNESHSVWALVWRRQNELCDSRALE